MKPLETLIQDIDARKTERARQASMEEKMLDGPRLFRLSCEAIKAGLRLDFPEATETELHSLKDVDIGRTIGYDCFMKVSATTIRKQAQSLPQEELKHLVLDLVPLLEGGFSAELQHILETRRRAAELKSGEVEALASGEIFSRARQAIS